MVGQHCDCWCLGAKVPGHQHPQYRFSNYHSTGVSHKQFIFILNTQIIFHLKKIPVVSGLKWVIYSPGFNELTPEFPVNLLCHQSRPLMSWQWLPHQYNTMPAEEMTQFCAYFWHRLDVAHFPGIVTLVTWFGSISRGWLQPITQSGCVYRVTNVREGLLRAPWNGYIPFNPIHTEWFLGNVKMYVPFVICWHRENTGNWNVSPWN